MRRTLARSVYHCRLASWSFPKHSINVKVVQVIVKHMFGEPSNLANSVHINFNSASRCSVRADFLTEKIMELKNTIIHL
jgi:hypothetical protein